LNFKAGICFELGSSSWYTTLVTKQLPSEKEGMKMDVSIKAERKYPYVETKAEVCGGSPVIEGTRIPIWSIIKWYKLGLSIEEIIREFPELTPSQVYDAFSYYYDHQEEIEKEISENEDESKWLKLIKEKGR